MNFAELLLLALVGWTAIGMLGILISLTRRERAKARHAAAWICGIWALYLVVLISVSLTQRQRVVALGQEQCFDDLCFAVIRSEKVAPFFGRNQPGDGSQLVRITIRGRNRGRGKTRAEGLLRAYLVDSQGRHWDQVPGLSGNRLTMRIPAGSEVISEPVFKVTADARGLGLVFTHGRWQPGVMVMGDSDSWWHKRTVVWLGL
jgi:hypothetical protein